MLQPAPMSTSQSNLWTCAMWYVVNHSGLMCLSSCLLRLFTCTVFTWWNVAPYNSLCVGGLCCAMYGCCSHVPPVTCAFRLWTFIGFCFLFASFVLPISLYSFPLRTLVTLGISDGALLFQLWRCCFTRVAGLANTLTSVFLSLSFPVWFHLHHV